MIHGGVGFVIFLGVLIIIIVCCGCPLAILASSNRY